MGLFKKKKMTVMSYDKDNEIPVIKKSICNGEEVAGFKNIHTGKMSEVMTIRSEKDLETFKISYGITDEIKVEY